MQSKHLLLIVALGFVIVVAVVILWTNYDDSKPSKNEVEVAINQAKYIYDLRKSQNQDFTLGPCLSDDLMPGWVLDIAHNPRLAVDDLAQNQCSAYKEGRAQHFVELDPDGNLIRAR